MSRRGTLQAAAAAATAVVAGPVLAACAQTPASGNAGSAAGAAGGVLPVPGSGVVHLFFQANVQFIPWNKTTAAIFQQFVDQNFNQNPQYKGIWASVFPTSWGNASGQIAASLAGKGYADVLHMCCGDIPTLEQAGMVVPLDPLLRRDNIPQTLWSKGHLDADSHAGHLYGLPSYDGTMAIFYRQDILDQLGLPYPDPSWTYKEAATLFQSCVGKTSTGKPRSGLSVYFDSGQLNWWLRGWGALEMDDTQEKALMNTTEAADCLTWVRDNMKSTAIFNGGQDTNILPSGRAVFAQYHSAHVVDVGAHLLGTSYKWNLLPNPIWPKGRSTFDTIDCYLVNQASKNPNEAWELMKWVNLGAPQAGGTFDNAWPKFQIQLNLVTPSLVQLWDYWQTTIVQVAPPLRNKDLKWFADAAQKNYAFCTLYYKYQPIQADGIVSNWLNQITSGKVSPQLGAQQMANQLNALEGASAQSAQALAGVSKLFPTTGANIAAVTPGL